MCIAQSGCSISKYMCMYYPQESTVRWTATSVIAITERGGFSAILQLIGPHELLLP